MKDFLQSLVLRKIKKTDDPSLHGLLWRRLALAVFHQACRRGYGAKWVVLSSVAVGLWVHSRGASPILSLCTAGSLVPLLMYLVARFIFVPVYMSVKIPEYRHGYFKVWDGRGDDKEMWLATYGDKVISAGGFCRESKDTAKIKSVVTEDGYTGRGVARLMVTVLIDRCRCIGYKKIVLDTIETQVESRHLYQTMGFKVERERTGFLYYIFPITTYSLALQ